MRAWLTRLGGHTIRPLEGTASAATYQALLPGFPHTTTVQPVLVRLYQRKNRLQVHHVDAFRGYLLRAGVPAGILVTTGSYAREAVAAASQGSLPRLFLYAGDQWARELAAFRIGVVHRRPWRWLLDLAGPGRGFQ
jgi:hypothetical protein